jgi:hypothetical protein
MALKRTNIATMMAMVPSVLVFIVISSIFDAQIIPGLFTTGICRREGFPLSEWIGHPGIP